MGTCVTLFYSIHVACDTHSMNHMWQIRIMKNRDTGESKGFAFVAFTAKDMAQKAIEELHNKEFKVICSHLRNFSIKLVFVV